MTVTITQERPDAPDALTLIAELEQYLDLPGYPPESRHGYSVEKLIAQGVAFFVLREDGAAAACGGVQLVGAEYGELKRMFVRPSFRRRGHARRIMEHLAAYTRERGVFLLRLETGTFQAEAISLYEAWGFTRIGPFGSYREDPLSIFMEKRI